MRRQGAGWVTPGGLPGGTQAGGQEAIDVGGVIARAVAAKHLGQIVAALADRQRVRRSPVGSWRLGLGAVGEQQFDDLRRAVRSHSGVEYRERTGGLTATFGGAGIEGPARVGTGPQP